MNKITQLEPSIISQDEYNILVSSKMYMSVLLSESVASDLINHYLATERSSQKTGIQIIYVLCGYLVVKNTIIKRIYELYNIMKL